MFLAAEEADVVRRRPEFDLAESQVHNILRAQRRRR
jgi:hypothetical protein